MNATKLHPINGAWFDVTPHATARALDMALDGEAIRETIGNPRHVQKGVGTRELWTRGPVTAVMEPRDGYWAVITFIWSTANGWALDRDLVRSRGAGPVSARREQAMRHAVKMRKKGLSR